MSKKEINIKIEGAEWKKALDKAFTKANSKAKIDGFRPGHAPKEVFLKKYGKEALYFDAADLCLQEAYIKVLDENKDLEIVAEPKVDLKKVDEAGAEFTFTFILKPEVKLGKYQDLGVKKPEIKVTKKEIDETIDEMRHRYAENVLKDGEIANGDIAIIDFEGFKDGVAFEGGKGENYSLEIGSGTFIPGFEEQLIGLKAGDTKDVNVTFPAEYHSEELKGQAVTFKVKVHEVKAINVPELNEEFFEDLGMEGVTSKESLKAEIKENIKARKEAENENKYIDELLETAAKNVEVDVPDEMVAEEVDRMLKQYEENLKMQGLTLKQFYQFTSSNEEALKDQMREEAKKRVVYRLMLEEIVKKEKLEVSDNDADAEASKLAEKYHMEKEDLLKNFGGIDMIKYDMEMRKAMDVLKK